MKTHDLARALSLLARMLKSGQNVELKDWPGPSPATGGELVNGISTADAATALNVLLGVSRFNKGQWRSLIEEWKLPVQVHRSDSVRDLLGRLLNYLDTHRDEAQRIQDESSKKTSKASPELTRVLSILLGGDKDEDAPAEKRGGKVKDRAEEKE